MKEKIFFGGLDMLKPKVHTPTKMPRTGIIPVVRDKETGYLNAAPYSGGVASIKPFHILFGPKSQTTIDTFREIDDFCVAIPNKSQINQMWVTGLGVPRGINEIEMAGWHTLPSKQIDTPGIDECPINLECRKIFFEKLPDPWRAVVVGEVVGVSINSELLNMSRAEVVRQIPMYESNVHPKTGLYGPSVLSGELVASSNFTPDLDSAKVESKNRWENGKVFVGGSDLYKSENEKILINAIYPMPAYFLMTKHKNKQSNILPITGGKLQSSIPTLTIPIPKDSYSYNNIKRTGEFLISIPDRSLISNFEEMEKNTPDGFESAGFTLLKENMVDVNGLEECPVNIDYKVVLLKDVPGMDYAILVGRKVGVSYNKDFYENLSQDWPNSRSIKYLYDFYSKYIYAVMDEGFSRKWGFHDPNPLSVRNSPSWGTRYGTSWTGPKYFNYWLIELVQEGLIAPRDLNKISTTLMLWNNGSGQQHVKEYYDQKFKDELCERLTKLFKMMAWAHRDYAKWEEVRKFIRK